MTQDNAPERTALYRCYAAGDLLLYVGITKRLGRRWSEHAKVQPWWFRVDRQTVNWLPSRGDAMAAEKAAIVDELPLFNIVHSTQTGLVLDEGTGFYIDPKRVRETPRPRYDELPAVYHGDGWHWPYERLAREIDAAIADGTYQSGQRLPSMDQLATTAGFSKSAVRNALAVLREQGKIETRPRLGTFVVERPAA